MKSFGGAKLVKNINKKEQTWYFNPFHATDLFRHPWKHQKIAEVFSCFQGVSQEISVMKWVNLVALCDKARLTLRG